MRLWINKCSDDDPIGKFKNAYVFSVKRKGSTIYTGLNDVWLMMGKKEIPSLYEDLFIIGLSIFAIDKRVSRKNSFDNWTRKLEVSIPVLEKEKWDCVKEKWENMLSFLTGDIWNISFRKSYDIFSKRNRSSSKRIDISGCTCVSLFSGGLDSFCGAIELLSKGESPCLIGHNEYPKLRKKQENLCKMFCNKYPKQKTVFASFTANSRAPKGEDGVLDIPENTSRGRSLLFLCAAVSIAGIIGDGTRIYVPENGFIGLNIPLTNNRKGTCSTRTTHPYFIKAYNEILDLVHINHRVENFFAFNSKREIVNQVKNTEVFKQGARLTISCSHPCLPRYKKEGNKTYPKNCGYCYPCLIRKSSMLDVDAFDGPYSQKELTYQFFSNHDNSDTTNDVAALMSALYRYENMDEDELIRLVKCTGYLSEDEISKFALLYKSTMCDVKELFAKDQKLIRYIGVD